MVLKWDVMGNLLRGGVECGDFTPIDDVPDGFEVIRPFVLVFQIVGMFPDIDTQDGFAFDTRDGLTH